MKINWYLLARLGVLAFTAFVYFSGRRNSDMWLWAMLSGYVICTFISDSRKTPKDERVSFPQQLLLGDGSICFIGTKRQFETYFGGWDVDAEAINMSAVRHSDGTIFAVDKGANHSLCADTMWQVKNNKGHLKDVGFLTSEGVYVDPYKALKIARLAGQVPAGEKFTEPQNVLSIEDIWRNRPRPVSSGEPELKAA